MKRIILLLLISVYMLGLSAQDFKVLTKVETTPVKDQNRSGTCWAFAGVSFVETELLRQGKGLYDLSEMYVVRKAYAEKAVNYVRLQGKGNFSSGGQGHDVINVIEKYGIVPEKVYKGIEYGETGHNHGEMDAMLNGMVSKLAENKVKHKDQVWLKAYEAVLDVYLGNDPENFQYEGKEYTPKTFATDLGFKPDEYIELTSYEAYPFYKQVVLQVPDNWSYDLYYNLPINDLMEIMEYALGNGFSICWDGDVSGDFNRQTGVAKLKDEEKNIGDRERQNAFDLFETTDDHLMHITGMARGDDEKLYYLTKNSWGSEGKFDGYWYMSEKYVRLNTVAILVHKDAIPKDIRVELGLK